MSIEKDNIRKFYYISSITITLSLVCMLSLFYFKNYLIDFENRMEQLYDKTIEMKKDYICNIVLRTIKQIDIERENVKNQVDLELNLYQEELDKMISQNSSISEIEIKMNIMTLGTDCVKFHIVNNKKNGEATKFNEQLFTFENNFDNYKFYRKVYNDHYLIFLICNKDIEKRVQKSMLDRIKREELSHQGYIWINKILNFNGGDDYAIRLIHPNLNHTEGKLLSTKDEDINGNKPYQDELDGINEDGQVFYEYYFAEKNSETISKKMSFAKLYKPFNWVIATGIHLDDIIELTENERKIMLEEKLDRFYQSLILTLVFVIFSVILMVLFEKRLITMINNYTETINNQKQLLLEEKRRIEKVAYTDDLTKISNRRAIKSDLHNFTNYSNDENEKIVLAIGDIDNFKNINDLYGH